MAMNDPSLDELLQLYRSAARETTAPGMDARVLHAAEREARTRRAWRHRGWPIAIAASLVLWAAWHPVAPMLGAAVTLPSEETLRLRHELQQLPVASPHSDITQYLLRDDAAFHPLIQPENTP